MRYVLLLLILSYPPSLLSLPCANGSGILYKNDTIAEVIKQCGEPTTRETRTETLSSLKQWTYYRNQPYGAGSAKMVVTFKDDSVFSIFINERYWLVLCRESMVFVGPLVTTQFTCGDWAYYTPRTHFCNYVFGVGDKLQTVKNSCGPPDSESDQTKTRERTVFTYMGDSPQTIIFQDGRLLEWQ